MDSIKKIKHFLYYWYVRYLLATELYMVEPWEKVVFHVVLLLLFGVVWILNYTIVVSSVAHLRNSINWKIL